MKRYLPFILGTVLGMLLTAVFFVGRASATTDCFTDTNGHWAETFICWLNDNGITTGYGDGTFGPDDNITRGQMAVFLQRMRATGLTYISTGVNGWRRNDDIGTAGVVALFSNIAQLGSSATGTQYFQLTPDIPTSLYNSQMYFNGARLCYDATNGATLSAVYLDHFLEDGTSFASLSDSTLRTDAACRTYSFPSPGPLLGGDHVALVLVVDFPSTSNYLFVSATTFILSPSANPPLLEPDTALQPSLNLPFDDSLPGRAP